MSLRRAVLFAVMWLALTALAGRCSAAVESEYACLRFLPHQTADVYLQFEGKWLVIADSAKGLEKAKPIRAMPSREKPPEGMSEQYGFPEVELPVSLDGVARVTAVFGITRYASSRLGRGPAQQTEAGEPNFWGARVYIHKKDLGGVTWTYLVFSGSEVTASDNPEGSPPEAIPAVTDLALSIVTAPSPGKLGVSLRLMAEGHPLNDVRRNDDSRLASVQVTDASGAVVASETGDLEKFGFT